MYSPNFQTAETPDSEKLEKENMRKKDRCDLKRYSLSAGLMVIVSSLLFVLFSNGLYLIINNIASRPYFPSWGDSILNDIISSITSLSAFLITGLIFLRVNKFSLSDALPFKRIKPLNFFTIITLGFSICMLSNNLTSAFMEVLKNFGLGTPYVSSSSNIITDSPFEFAVSLLSTAIVPAISEEFVFRGVMLSSLRKFGDGFALLATSLLFGFMHGNLTQIPFAFIVGLILGFAAVSTNSMLPSITIHALNNAYSVLNSFLYKNYKDLGMTSEAVFLILATIIAVFLILSIILTFILSKKDKKFAKLNAYSGPLLNREINRGFYLFPTVIIAFIYMTAEAILPYLPIKII